MTVSLAPRDRAAHPPALTPGYRSTVLRAPERPLLTLPATPAEETGPVFAPDLLGPLDHDLTLNFSPDGTPAIGERILVHGRLRDGADRPVPGALIEIWQANAGGRYRHVNDGFRGPLDPRFGGCGRTLTDETGHYRFMTIRPGAYPWPNGGNDWRPMHIHFSVFGHAFGQRLVTQMYFEGDPLIPLCPILDSIGDPGQVERLTAPLDMAGARPFEHLAYRFDITLRGPRQTMFENRP